MPNEQEERIPVQECAPPGLVKVTPRALKLAENFQASVPSGWIVAFNWFDGGRVRKGRDAPWIDLGPHVDLGAFRIGQIPEEAICHAGPLRYAVLIRGDILEDYPEKTIDLDGQRKVVLR